MVLVVVVVALETYALPGGDVPFVGVHTCVVINALP